MKLTAMPREAGYVGFELRNVGATRASQGRKLPACRLRQEVQNMDHPLRFSESAKGRIGTRMDQRIALSQLNIGGRHTMRCDVAKPIVLTKDQDSKIGLADAYRVRERLKTRCPVCLSRGVGHLGHLGQPL